MGEFVLSSWRMHFFWISPRGNLVPTLSPPLPPEGGKGGLRATASNFLEVLQRKCITEDKEASESRRRTPGWNDRVTICGFGIERDTEGHKQLGEFQDPFIPNPYRAK
jgi:hypothetical protein